MSEWLPADEALVIVCAFGLTFLGVAATKALAKLDHILAELKYLNRDEQARADERVLDGKIRRVQRWQEAEEGPE